MSDFNEFTPELYELIDENGNKKNFEMLDAAELNGIQYFAMIPAIESKDFLYDNGELVILKSEYSDSEDVLVSVDDDFEYKSVSEFFMQRLNEILEGDDDDDDSSEQIN
ncbi:MAG: DUF1292 domain-containing protein [Ruminococcus sp.]|nr:DUF1292 domain-containing protein [Ruminococcus sp.]